MLTGFGLLSCIERSKGEECGGDVKVNNVKVLSIIAIVVAGWFSIGHNR